LLIFFQSRGGDAGEEGRLAQFSEILELDPRFLDASMG
jgi:hypothetical protein